MSTLAPTRLPAPAVPTGTVRAVLDTDAFNEVDDQFALAHALLSPDRIKLEAVYAAPFLNTRASSPGEGMVRSHAEILQVLHHLGHERICPVRRGSTAFLSSRAIAVESEAATDLIQRAHAGPDPLYVIAIAAATNVASALILDPSIASKIVVVWLGGNAWHWPHSREFNLEQDPVAARILLENEVPLVQVPCMGVVQMLATTLPEIEQCLGGRPGIAGFLHERVRAFPDKPQDVYCWHKVMWDVAATAWLVNPEWCPSEVRPCPVLTPELTWSSWESGREIRYVREVKRDPIFADLFRKLLKASAVS